MSLSSAEWTAEMLGGLPDDGNRYEVIDGVLLVTPAPSFLHQYAVAELFLILSPYVKAVGLEILLAPAAVRFSRRREVQPDLLVLPRNAGRRPRRFEDVGVLLLAVEVLSRFSALRDRHVKRALYQNEGVAEYWIIDPSSRTVERWRPDSIELEVHATRLTWQPVPLQEALSIDLRAYFRAVFGEDR